MYFCFMNLTEKRQYMFSLIDQWKKSGLSQRKFSKIHGVDYRQLNYWIGAKAKTESSGSFIPLHPSTDDQSPNKIEVVFPNGVIVRTTFVRDIIQQLLSLS